jgi:hypothetical protein
MSEPLTNEECRKLYEKIRRMPKRDLVDWAIREIQYSGRLRKALESMEPIWLNQQLSTLAVAKAMLDTAKRALAPVETT